MKICLIAFLLFSLLLLGCTNASECEQINKQEWKDKCYMDEAKEKNDPSLCGNIIYKDWAILCRDQFND
ncbi:MAG: hypothetical protein ABIG39_00090 [Candidatus Micrarchaeota archaeon]